MLLLAITVSLLTGALVGDYKGFKRGFRFGCKDEQLLFSLVVSRLADKNQDPNLLNNVIREYNLVILELKQGIKDMQQGKFDA